MKKEIFIFAVSLLILPLMLNFILADDFDSAASEALGVNYSQIEEASTNLNSWSWDYLSNEWKTMLLGNSFVKGADSFLQSINVVFFVLFGIDYSLSLKFLLVVILWFYVLFRFDNLFKDVTLFSRGVSFVISFGLMIVMAHMGIIEAPVDGIMWLFFSQKTWWMKLIIAVVIIAVLVFIAILIKKFGFRFKENRKKMKEEMERMQLERGAKVGEALSKAAAKGEYFNNSILLFL